MNYIVFNLNLRNSSMYVAVFTVYLHPTTVHLNTGEPLLRGHPDERPIPLEMLLDTVNLNIDILIYIGVTSQFHCSQKWPR